jgi:HK97 family phage prohead protease
MPVKTPDLERKTLPCEVKAAADDGSFELYALTFGNIDRVGDIILPGAVSNVDELVKDGWGALNHSNMALPVAYPESATQDAKGLLVKGRFHSTPDAQAVRTVVRERMAAGKSVPCSIGYVVDDAGFETRGGEPVRLLKSIRVFEFSFVNLPANPAAGVVSAKSLEDEPGWLDRLKALLGLDAKRGRVVSAANHGRLSGHAAKLEEVATDLKAFLADHDPNKGEPEADAKADALAKLRRRALEGRRSMRCP